jgi:hypothetical protein
MKVLTRLRLLFVVLCCVSWSAEPLPAQTSPKGTFKIETVEKPAEDPTADPYEQQYVVSIADPNLREPLGEPRQAQPAKYFISPDENWIFTTIHFGSGMSGGQLFKRHEGLKFQPVEKDFEESVWHFFDQDQHIHEDDRQTSLIDFVAWSPDSGRLLIDLRGGGFGGERSRGIYEWYVYFNTKTGKFELTEYLRRLNKDAWKRWKNFSPFPIFPEAASAESLGELPSEAESKKRYQVADQHVRELFQKLVGIEETQLQQSIHDEQTSQTQRETYQEQLKSSRDWQRNWIKTRKIGAKLYADSGPKSTATRRYWQHMADSTEARANALKDQIESEEH